MKKFIFIINPISGGGKALALKEAIEEVSKQKQLDYEIIYTTAPGDAAKIANEHRRQDCVIYSVGGDGTLNEVVTGLAKGISKAKSLIGIIPGGSGNDFYKTLKLYDDKILSCDIGKFNDRYFVNTASIGLDSEIAMNASLMKRNKLIPKSQIYTASALYTLALSDDKDYSVKVDDETIKAKHTMITIANGRYYGGGYQIAPRAQINDGYFDVYLIDGMAKFTKLGLMLKLIRSKHESSPRVKHIKAKSITVESDSLVTAGVDGETCQSKKFKIKIYPKLLKFYNDKEFVEDILEYKKRNKYL